jgi:hypothetical protein
MGRPGEAEGASRSAAREAAAHSLLASLPEVAPTLRLLLPPSVDDQGVRRAAEEHVRSIVEGRIKDALPYVVQEMRAKTAANLLKVAHPQRRPRPTTGVSKETRRSSVSDSAQRTTHEGTSRSRASGGRSTGGLSSSAPSRSEAPRRERRRRAWSMCRYTPPQDPNSNTPSSVIVRFTALPKAERSRSLRRDRDGARLVPDGDGREGCGGSDLLRSGYYPDGAVRQRRKRWTIRR